MKLNKRGMEIAFLAKIILGLLLLFVILYFLAKAFPAMIDKVKSIFRFW